MISRNSNEGGGKRAFWSASRELRTFLLFVTILALPTGQYPCGLLLGNVVLLGVPANLLLTEHAGYGLVHLFRSRFFLLLAQPEHLAPRFTAAILRVDMCPAEFSFNLTYATSTTPQP